jgi:hypothetical protein
MVPGRYEYSCGISAPFAPESSIIGGDFRVRSRGLIMKLHQEVGEGSA